MCDWESNCSLPKLPLEIIEHILTFSDGPTLEAASLINSTFQQILDRSSRKFSKVWKRVCYDTIPRVYLDDIINDMFPRNGLGQDVCWKDVYYAWGTYNALEKDSDNLIFFSQHLFSTKYYISCVAVSGPWVFIGTRCQGSLTAFNLHTEETKVLYKGSGIVRMTLNNYLPLDLVDDDTLPLPGVEHEELILELDIRADGIFDFQSLELRLFPRFSEMSELKKFRDKQVRVISNIQRSDIVISDLKSDSTLTLECMEIWQPICIWQDLVLFNKDLNFHVLDFKLRDVEHPINGKPSPVRERTVTFASSYNRWDNTLIAIAINPDWYCSGNQKLVIFVNDEQVTIIPYEVLFENISAIDFHSGILTVGTCDGNIYLYFFPEPKDLLKLNLSKPSIKIESQIRSGIVAIKFSFKDGHPCVFASSVNNAFVFSLNEN